MTSARSTNAWEADMRSPDPIIQGLRDLRADDAAAAGHEWSHRRNLERVARLKAMRFSWEEPAA
jgi:hypothetical protein